MARTSSTSDHDSQEEEHQFEHEDRDDRHFEELAWTQWMKTVPDDHRLPMTGEPGNIRVLVAGGPGKHTLLVPSWGMTRSVTLPVEG